MSTKIDDTKKCICSPALSGKNKKCLRCHPRKTVVVAASGPRDFKPAQAKKHNAVKTGLLPWLQEKPETDEVTTAESEDPYANYPEG